MSKADTNTKSSTLTFENANNIVYIFNLMDGDTVAGKLMNADDFTYTVGWPMSVHREENLHFMRRIPFSGTYLVKFRKDHILDFGIAWNEFAALYTSAVLSTLEHEPQSKAALMKYKDYIINELGHTDTLIH